MKIIVLFDVFNISNRVKDIDRDYYIVYNTSNQKFEIHHSNQIGGSYCLTLPFDKLDERALKHVRSSQSNNIEQILEQIEVDNKLRESTMKTSAFSNIVDIIEQELEIE